METTATIDDAEVRFKGIVALNEALGPVGALRFLTLLHRDRTDYVEIPASVRRSKHRRYLLTRPQTMAGMTSI